MPVLSVEVVGDDLSDHTDDLAARLADEVAPHFGSALERTWVRLRYLPRARYAEGGGGPGSEVKPVFVSILLAELPSVRKRQSLALGLASTIARVTARPKENVHIFFEPQGKGRVAFGGQLVK